MISHVVIEERVIQHRVCVRVELAGSQATLIQHTGAYIFYSYSKFADKTAPFLNNKTSRIADSLHRRLPDPYTWQIPGSYSNKQNPTPDNKGRSRSGVPLLERSFSVFRKS